MPDAVDLTGRVALVSGAGSGIGRGCAVALGGAGCSVAVNDIDSAAAGETVDLIAAVGGKAAAFVADVSRSEQVSDMLDGIVDAFGGLDILHANAGVERYVDLENMPDTDLERILAVDLRGALLCARAAIAPMRAAGRGAIVFTSSVQATHSLPGSVVYAAAKAGLVAAARTLAVEVGAAGIRVNTLSPGTIETPMFEVALSGMDREGAADFRSRVEAATALGRVGGVDEIAAALLFLVSDNGSYVTGTNLVVDGGFTAVKRI